MFSVVNQADDFVRRDLEEWIRIAVLNVNQAIANDSPLKSKIQANFRIILLIQEGALVQPEDFRGVRDQSGNLQAGAIETGEGSASVPEMMLTPKAARDFLDNITAE